MASLTSVAFTGPSLKSKAPSTIQPKRFTTVAMSVKKGINKAIKYGSPNTGSSKVIKDKSFVDPSGRKGTGKGIYQFESKYGANVDGYSPIYSPGEWKTDGDVYEGGPLGLAIWFVGLLSLLGVGAYAIYNTSAL